MSFPRYAVYKDSGVEWLGEVPQGWGVAPLKRHFQIIGGSTPKSDNEEYWDGDIIWVTPSDLSKLSGLEIGNSQRKITTKGLHSCGTTLAPIGSIILSTRAPIGSLAIATTEFCTNQGCKSLIPTANTDSRFYGYLLSISSTELNIRGKGTTFLELSGDELGFFKTPFPPITEQTTIAAFLDCETAKIDNLINEQKKLIELLKEKRQAVISTAVTKGLNPNAPMKDSCVEWLGEVPQGWGVCQFRRVILNIEQGWSPECENNPVEEFEWGVLKSGCVNGGFFNDEENKMLPSLLSPKIEYQVKNGDLLMSRASGSPKLIGSIALVGEIKKRLMLSDKIFRINLAEDKILKNFMSWLGVSLPFRLQIEGAISGAEGLANNLPQANIKKFWITLPSLPEQATIIAFLDQETAKIDNLIQQAQKATTLLQERRTALISAAVTGKIDVREYKSLPASL